MCSTQPKVKVCAPFHFACLPVDHKKSPPFPVVFFAPNLDFLSMPPLWVAYRWPNSGDEPNRSHDSLKLIVYAISPTVSPHHAIIVENTKTKRLYSFQSPSICLGNNAE
jgi:hypothetical protein